MTHLHSVVAEEEARVGAHAHLQAGGASPNRRFPNQQIEGTTFIAVIARAEDIFDKERRLVCLVNLLETDLLMTRSQLRRVYRIRISYTII